MRLYNTLTLKTEDFKPIDKSKVGIYTCGPTVYDAAHIGNFRAYVFNDLLKRTLVQNGYKVTHVMNLTDVDDKTIGRSQGKKEEFKKLINSCEDKFWADMDDLNIIHPDVVTRATEYIDKIVVFVKDLLDRGYAYKAEDGSIYFSIHKFKDYGKLSRLDKEGIMSGARVSQDQYDKENPSDFALWKAWDEGDGEIFWETELGKGRPGWSIECSAMSQDVLGETIDIHTGGVDLIFPHHENEIAQSEARTGKKFVNYWLHNEHLLVDGRKMSKSLGNFYVLDDIKKRGFSPLDLRYFYLGAHYRSKINFTLEGLEAAKNSRLRMQRIIAGLPSTGGKVNNEYSRKFNEAITEDLSTPQALAIAWEVLRDEKMSDNDKWATILDFDNILGLKLDGTIRIEIPAEVEKLAEERKTVREKGDFERSDVLREQISALGWIIEDRPKNEYKLAKSQKQKDQS